VHLARHTFLDANMTSSQSQSQSATNPELAAVQQPPATVYPNHFPIPSTPTAVQTRKRPSVSPGPGRNAAKGLARDEILERARERRRQLMTEIERAKVELWETTIEQGVLSQLIKDRA